MRKSLPFCVDHFSVGTPNRFEAHNTLTALGFVTGDTYKDRSSHFICDNSYTEINFREADKPITWMSATIPVGKLPRVHSYRLSNRTTNAQDAYDALGAGGIPDISEPQQIYRQRTKYGDLHGEAGYQSVFINNFEPVTDVLFGVTTHLNKDVVLQPTRFKHTNGVKRIEHLVWYCRDEALFAKAEESFGRLYGALQNQCDVGRCIDTAVLIDKAGYEEQFRCPPPEPAEFPVVAAAYSGCDLEYLCEMADHAGLNHFEADGQVVVDTRKTLGIHLIFSK